MLKIATVVMRSPIHGHGCFSGEFVRAGLVVWELNPEIEDAFHSEVEDMICPWVRSHSYRSIVADKIWVLPRDNAAYINFSRTPNLTMGRIVNGEPCLIAARNIYRWEELTVGTQTDADAVWKVPGLMSKAQGQ